MSAVNTNLAKPALVSSTYVLGQLRALDAKLIIIHAEADSIAYASVSGDPDAIKRLDAINAEVERAKRERGVLERALKKAEEREAAEALAADKAAKAAAFVDAGLRAREFVALCERIDAMGVEFHALMNSITAGERGLHDLMRAAGRINHNSGTIANRSRLAFVAHGNLLKRVDAPYHEFPAVADLARRAWAEVLDQERGAN